MTGPANGAQTPWDAPIDETGQADAAQKMSRLVAGNDHLVTQPGLVQALFESNATSAQAQAINQFLVGLNAEKAVRAASGSGHKIALDGDQRAALDNMGVDYTPVLQTPADAVAQLTAQMAQHGVAPVLDAKGNVQTDASGNPLTKPLEQPAEHHGWSFGRVLHDVTHNPVTNVVGTGLNDSWNWASSTVSGGLHDIAYNAQDSMTGAEQAMKVSATNQGAAVSAPASAEGERVHNQNAALMQQLGYDPSSFFSTQAFKAHGLAHSDTTSAAAAWHDGDFGWDGSTAVTQAEAFAANPEKYRTALASNTAETPEQVAQHLQAISSVQFQTLVKRVNASREDIGNDVASSVGIDPVEHSTLYTTVSTGANLAASFFLDPIAIGLGGLQAARVGAATVRNLGDAEDVRRFFTGSAASLSQRTVRGNLKALVDHGNDLRAAQAAGDDAKVASIAAAAGRNPFGGLLEDFTGRNQIVGWKTDAEIEKLTRGELPFHVGEAEPIDTYKKAVDYLSSKSALLKLQGGFAPVQASVMPGALSLYGYDRLRGQLSAWSAGRAASRSLADQAKFYSWATADPLRARQLIDDGVLTRFEAHSDDAVDVLSGHVLAAQQAVDASTQLAEKWTGEAAASHSAWRGAIAQGKASGKWDSRINDLTANAALSKNAAAAAGTQLDADTARLASAQRALAEAHATKWAEPALTDAGRGAVRRNKLDYGRAVAPESRVGRIAAWGTTGVAERAKLALTRFTNWLPRDTHVDLLSASSADTVRKIARTYLNSGDANMLAARWVTGNAETRKAMVEGLKDQLGHAAGLSRTKAGRELMTKWKTESQRYSVLGDEWLDPNGQAAALFPGQVKTRFNLPNFGAVHKAAAKVGLYEATMGRLLGSAPMEKLLIQWKLGALFTPVTAMRANLETWLNSAADGMFVDGLQAKAMLREVGKLDHPLVRRSRPVDRVLRLAPLQAAGRFYRHVLLSRMPEEKMLALRGMSDDLYDAYIHEQSALHYANEVDPGGTSEITQMAQDGFQPGQVKYNTDEAWSAALRTRKGYELTDEVDGLQGANAYAHTLAARVNDSPEVAGVILDRIEDGEATTVDDVVKVLDNDRLMNHTLYGKVYRTPEGQQLKAATDAEVLVGKRQWAEHMTEDFRQLLTGRNGVFQKGMADHIRNTGRAPHADWILDNVKQMNRPQSVLRPIFTALPTKNTPAGLVQSLLDVEGRGYSWMVERLIQRHSTAPMFSAAYADSKVGLSGWKDQLIKHGLSDDAAERAVQTAAMDQAWSRIARMVDDPRMKSQMDVVGRNFFAFSRATTMMLRRWGSTFWRNPVAARRMMLAAEGAVHSGLVYQDENGQWMFSFPASGVAQEVLLHAMQHIPGLSDLAMFPVSDFQGRVTSIIPGSDNPFQYQTTPMVSIAMRTIASKFPDHREWFDEIDRKLNGTAGQGQGVAATLTPNLVKKFTDVHNDNDRDSITASAMVGGLYNLYAAGQVPPDGASPSEMDDFYANLKRQTKNQLYLRALFGAFSPASLALPDNETGASAPDAAYAASGARGLNDEYKRLINETGGDIARANAIWAALHPDKLVYEQSGSQAITSHAYLPSTQEAFQWLTRNRGFIDKYKSVAAFFLPTPSGEEPFSMDAYRAQLETGLRERKTPQEFLNGVRVADASSTYYAVEDKYKADLAQAKASGDDVAAKKHRDDWLAWSKQYKATHATFSSHLYGSAESRVAARGQLDDLRRMAHGGDVPGGPKVSAAVGGMVKAYDGYDQFLSAHPGTDSQSRAAKSAAFAQLQDYLNGVVSAVPSVADVYSGVFRVLNSNLEQTEVSP